MGLSMSFWMLKIMPKGTGSLDNDDYW
jgi:hypothetical protein